jgi:hypothetical protein
MAISMSMFLPIPSTFHISNCDHVLPSGAC